MRRYIIFIISLLLLSGSISTIFATRDARDYQLRGYVDATQTTDLPYRIPQFGVNANLFQYDTDELAQHLGWMQEAHVTWIRQFIYWNEFEPEMGRYEWERLDDVMLALADFPQLQLIPVFMNSPEWARRSEMATSPPDDPGTIVPFLREFATRYGESIDYYQIWDEPNLDDTWGLSDPRPADYVALLAESYRAIHSSDYDATVIAAALAPTTEHSGQNIADNLYLQMMYDLGASDYFDAAAGKPYGFDLSPNDRSVNIDTLNFSRLILLREVMVANGDGDKALWASNFGWNSLADDWSGKASIWGSTSENDRLHYTIKSLNRAEREWTWLGGMILHHWQPDVAEDDPQWGFSIINQENEPGSLWNALVAYQTPVASNGLYHPRTPYADYSGLWTFSERGADIGWLETSDSQLDFEFYGTDIALLLREGDYFAFLYPTINGDVPNATAHDADGKSYILLRSGSQQAELNIVPVARNLVLDRHNLHVVADRGWDQWALAGYAVSSGDFAVSYTRQIQMAWLTTLAALLATVVSGYFLPWKPIYQYFYRVTSFLNQGLQFIITVATSIALMLGLLMSVGMSEPALFRRDMVEQALMIIITGGLIIIELPILLVIVATLVLFWLIYHHLEWGLLLVLFYAPFFLFPVELYTFFFPMSELLLLITTAAGLLRLFVQWGEERQSENSDYPLRLTIKWHLLDALMLLWLILGVIAVSWSARLSPAITELRALFIEPFLFYIILRSIKPTQSIIRQWILALITAGVLVSVIGLYQYFTGEGVITAEGGARRLASVYGSPNNVGLLLGRIIPFVFAGVLILRQRMRLIAGAILFLLLVTVAFTQSVGAILIGVPAGIIAVLLANYGRKAIPALAIFLIAGVIVTIGLTQVSTRFASLLDLSSGTNFIRIRVWESSLEIIANRPLTGLGLDQYLYEFSGHYVRPDAIADPDLSHPHNMVLDFWIRLGLPGLIWLAIFMVVFWREAFRLLHQEHEIENRIIIIGTIGAVAALISHGMIDNSIYVNDLIIIFVFLVAIIVQFSDDTGALRTG